MAKRTGPADVGCTRGNGTLIRVDDNPSDELLCVLGQGDETIGILKRFAENVLIVTFQTPAGKINKKLFPPAGRIKAEEFAGKTPGAQLWRSGLQPVLIV